MLWSAMRSQLKCACNYLYQWYLGSHCQFSAGTGYFPSLELLHHVSLTQVYWDLMKTIISPPCPQCLTVFNRNNQTQLWVSHSPHVPLKYSTVCCNICRWFHAWKSILMPLQNTRLGSLLKHLVILLLNGEACFCLQYMHFLYLKWIFESLH